MGRKPGRLTVIHPAKTAKRAGNYGYRINQDLVRWCWLESLVELNIMQDKERPFSYAPLRIVAILFGAVSVAMGWEALSQGYLWHSGYNARIGTETTEATLSWVIIGGLFILGGIFPWGWLVNRPKR